MSGLNYYIETFSNTQITKELDVFIDSFTPCLEHRESGEIYSTEVSFVTNEDLKIIGPKQGWNNFNWKTYFKHPKCEVKKLTIKGDDQIQGLLAYEPNDGWVNIHLVESAPWNIKGKVFLGVGPHLFAIACQKSFELGFDGYVTFIAKTRLVEHYQRTLGADLLNPKIRQMVLETEAAEKLVSTYF